MEGIFFQIVDLIVQGTLDSFLGISIESRGKRPGNRKERRCRDRRIRTHRGFMNMLDWFLMSSGITTGQREENRFRIRSLSNSIFQRSDRILLVAVRTGEEIELRIASFMLKTNETRIESTKIGESDYNIWYLLRRTSFKDSYSPAASSESDRWESCWCCCCWIDLFFFLRISEFLFFKGRILCSLAWSWSMMVSDRLSWFFFSFESEREENVGEWGDWKGLADDFFVVVREP